METTQPMMSQGRETNPLLSDNRAIQTTGPEHKQAHPLAVLHRKVLNEAATHTCKLIYQPDADLNALSISVEGLESWIFSIRKQGSLEDREIREILFEKGFDAETIGKLMCGQESTQIKDPVYLTARCARKNVRTVEIP